jgi:hypothetical protein
VNIASLTFAVPHVLLARSCDTSSLMRNIPVCSSTADQSAPPPSSGAHSVSQEEGL